MTDYEQDFVDHQLSDFLGELKRQLVKDYPPPIAKQCDYLPLHDPRRQRACARCGRLKEHPSHD